MKGFCIFSYLSKDRSVKTALYPSKCRRLPSRGRRFPSNCYRFPCCGCQLPATRQAQCRGCPPPKKARPVPFPKRCWSPRTPSACDRVPQVADASPDNPLLQGRGNPGTHDVALGAATLRRLTHWRPGGRVPVPRYDKSARGGAGDRLPPGQWPVVTERPQVVFFEGWCLGFEPVAAAALCDPCLAPVNAALGEQFEAWTGALDALVVVQVLRPRRPPASVSVRGQGSGLSLRDEVFLLVCRAGRPEGGRIWLTDGG